MKLLPTTKTNKDQDRVICALRKNSKVLITNFYVCYVILYFHKIPYKDKIFQVVGGNGAQQTVVSGSMEVLRPCWAVATSGVPVREQLFNASICHHSPFNLFQHGDMSRSFSGNADMDSLEVATPILIPRDDGHRHRRGSHGDVVFLTNRGEVSYLSALTYFFTSAMLETDIVIVCHHMKITLVYGRSCFCPFVL